MLLFFQDTNYYFIYHVWWLCVHDYLPIKPHAVFLKITQVWESYLTDLVCSWLAVLLLLNLGTMFLHPNFLICERKKGWTVYLLGFWALNSMTSRGKTFLIPINSKRQIKLSWYWNFVKPNTEINAVSAMLGCFTSWSTDMTKDNWSSEYAIKIIILILWWYSQVFAIF